MFDIDGFDVGRAGFIVNALGAKGGIEDTVNVALEEIDLQQPPYRNVIEEVDVTASGGWSWCIPAPSDRRCQYARLPR